MNGFPRHTRDRWANVAYGPLLSKPPSAPAMPSPPTPAAGSASTSNASNQNAQLSAQAAASLQGGTVMGQNNGSKTTKTLLGQ